MAETDELLERLAPESPPTIRADVRARHLVSIRAELIEPTTTAPAPLRSRERPVASWRVATLAAGLLVIAVATAAFLRGEPGGSLYSTKRVVEQVVAVVDNDVVATNRLDELEATIARRADAGTVSRAQTEARNAVADLPAGDPHRERLTRLFLSPTGLGLEPHHFEVDWDTDPSFVTSLDGGGLLEIRRDASVHRLAVTGDYTAEAVGQRQWLVLAGSAVDGERADLLVSVGVRTVAVERADRAELLARVSGGGGDPASSPATAESGEGTPPPPTGPRSSVAPSPSSPTTSPQSTTGPTAAPTTTTSVTTTSTTRPTTSTTRPTTTTTSDDDDDDDDDD